MTDHDQNQPEPAPQNAEAPFLQCEKDKADRPHVGATKQTETHVQSSVGIMTVVVACVITASTTLAGVLWAIRNMEPQQIVFINTQKLVEAKTVEIIDVGTFGKESASKEGRKFAEQLKAEIERYTKLGYTVVNGAALLSEDVAIDLTADIAQTLNVNLALAGRRQTQRP